MIVVTPWPEPNCTYSAISASVVLLLLRSHLLAASVEVNTVEVFSFTFQRWLRYFQVRFCTFRLGVITNKSRTCVGCVRGVQTASV